MKLQKIFSICLLTMLFSLSVNGSQRQKRRARALTPPPSSTEIKAAAGTKPVAIAEMPLPISPEIMPLREVKPGMVGYGLSVFRGTTPERFGFVVDGINRLLKGYESINVTCYDLSNNTPLNKTEIISGMSGSPMFIGDKLVGALAASPEFAKDGDALITPIENMLRFVPKILNEPNKYLLPSAQPSLATTNPLPELRTGESYCSFLVWGDINFASNATITYIDKKSGYIFSQGHAGMNPQALGKTALPFGKANVFKSVATLKESFKLAEPVGPMLGAVVLDAHWGQIIKLGVSPRGIPFHVKIEGVLDETIETQFQVAYTSQASNLITMVLQHLAGTTIDQSQATHFTARITIKDQQEIFISDNYDEGFKSMMEILNTLISNPNEKLEIENIQVSIKPESQNDLYVIREVEVLFSTPDRMLLKMTIKKLSDNSEYQRNIPITLPVGLSYFGKKLVISDGATLQSKFLSCGNLDNVWDALYLISGRQILYLYLSNLSDPTPQTSVFNIPTPSWEPKPISLPLIIAVIDPGLKLNGSKEFFIPRPILPAQLLDDDTQEIDTKIDKKTKNKK